MMETSELQGLRSEWDRKDQTGQPVAPTTQGITRISESAGQSVPPLIEKQALPPDGNSQNLLPVKVISLPESDGKIMVPKGHRIPLHWDPNNLTIRRLVEDGFRKEDFLPPQPPRARKLGRRGVK